MSHASAIHSQHRIGDVSFFPFGGHFLPLARLFFAGSTFLLLTRPFIPARLFFAGATFFSGSHLYLVRGVTGDPPEHIVV